MMAALAMSTGTLMSRVLGLVRDQVLAGFFSRTITDAFVVAFRLPNMFRRLLGEGALSVSFIPVFIEQLQPKEGESSELARQRAKKLSEGVFTILMSVVATLSVLGVVFMEEILSFFVTGQGYLSVPGKFATTVVMGRIMFSYLFLVATYAFFMTILNALKYFLVAAMAPALFNLTFIIFAILPSAWSSFPGQLLAWGVIAGGVVQVLIVAIPLYRLGYIPRLRWRWKSPAAIKVFKNMLPGTIGMGIYQLLGVVNISFASRLEEGAHSYIFWADRILELPQSLIAISLGAALLPTLSEQLSEGNKEKMLATGQRFMKTLLFLAIPASMGMFLLAQPIVEVIYMRGNFNLLDAKITSSVVQIYAFLLLSSSLNKVVIPNFYAIQNTWLPAATSVFSLLIHCVVANFWVDWYGLKGLVASTMMASMINLGINLFCYHFMIGPLHFKQLLRDVLRFLPGASVMSLFVFVVYEPWHLMLHFLGVELSRIFALLSVIVVAVVIYFLVSRLFKVQQVDIVFKRFEAKLKK